MKKNITEDNIRVAAYYIWEQAGRPEGADKECWIKACEQLFNAGKKQKAEKKAVVKAEKKDVVKKVTKAPAKKAEKPVATTPFYGKK